MQYTAQSRPLALICAGILAGASASAPAAENAPPSSVSVAVGHAQNTAPVSLSQYIQAREQLNRGNYREAAELFGQVAKSSNMEGGGADALYWQAFALYRLGTADDLKQARTILEKQRRELQVSGNRMSAALESHFREMQVANEAQIRRAQENLERQQRESRKQAEQQRKQAAEALERTRKEVRANQEAQEAANARMLAELKERNSQALADLDERRKQALARYEEQSKRVEENFKQQQELNRRSKAALEALERQHQFSLQVLQEQRDQTQAQFEAQRQQFLEAFNQQREQTRQALVLQQERLGQSITIREEQNKHMLEQVDQRQAQMLEALEQNREFLQKQFDAQNQSRTEGFRQQLAQLHERLAEQNEQSLQLSQRIAGALAQRGDASAERQVRESLNAAAPCADEAQTSVRLESMIAMSKMDPGAVRPVLRQILSRGSQCSKPMRERAVFLLSLQRDEPAGRMLVQVVRAESDIELRQQALVSLSNNAALDDISGDLVRLYDELRDPPLKQQLIVLYGRAQTAPATAKLISIVRSEKDTRLREQSIAVLGGPGDPRVQRALKETASRE